MGLARLLCEPSGVYELIMAKGIQITAVVSGTLAYGAVGLFKV